MIAFSAVSTWSLMQCNVFSTNSRDENYIVCHLTNALARLHTDCIRVCHFRLSVSVTLKSRTRWHTMILVLELLNGLAIRSELAQGR